MPASPLPDADVQRLSPIFGACAPRRSTLRRREMWHAVHMSSTIRAGAETAT